MKWEGSARPARPTGQSGGRRPCCCRKRRRGLPLRSSEIQPAPRKRRPKQEHDLVHQRAHGCVRLSGLEPHPGHCSGGQSARRERRATQQTSIHLDDYVSRGTAGIAPKLPRPSMFPSEPALDLRTDRRLKTDDHGAQEELEDGPNLRAFDRPESGLPNVTLLCATRKFVPVGRPMVVIIAAAVVARSNDLRTGPIEAAEIGPMGHSPLPQATKPMSSGRYRRIALVCSLLGTSPVRQRRKSAWTSDTRHDRALRGQQTKPQGPSPTAHNGNAEREETRRWRDGEMERWRVLDLIRLLRARSLC